MSVTSVDTSHWKTVDYFARFLYTVVWRNSHAGGIFRTGDNLTTDTREQRVWSAYRRIAFDVSPSGLAHHRMGGLLMRLRQPTTAEAKKVKKIHETRPNTRKTEQQAATVASISIGTAITKNSNATFDSSASDVLKDPIIGFDANEFTQASARYNKEIEADHRRKAEESELSNDTNFIPPVLRHQIANVRTITPTRVDLTEADEDLSQYDDVEREGNQETTAEVLMTA